MALEPFFILAIASSVAHGMPATTSSVSPTRSYIESFCDISLIGVNEFDVVSTVDEQGDSFDDLGPAESVAIIDSEQGFYIAKSDTFATFDGPNHGTFDADIFYQGRRGQGDVEATLFEHTLWSIYEYDFTIPDTGTLNISGSLHNGGPSSISYFGFVQVFSENVPEGGYGDAFFLHEIFDFGLDGQSINLQVPLEASSNSYRIHMRIGHIGTTTLDAQLSEGSMSVEFDIDAPSNCRADLDQNGVLDFFDVSRFLVALNNNDPIADFNDDGTNDFFDISAFLTDFVEGCP